MTVPDTIKPFALVSLSDMPHVYASDFVVLMKTLARATEDNPVPDRADAHGEAKDLRLLAAWYELDIDPAFGEKPPDDGPKDVLRFPTTVKNCLTGAAAAGAPPDLGIRRKAGRRFVAAFARMRGTLPILVTLPHSGECGYPKIKVGRRTRRHRTAYAGRLPTSGGTPGGRESS